MKNFPQRKSIRLKNCDYSENGFYYVTVCTQNRECLFGDIIDRKMVLNGAGKIIQNIWELLPGHYSVKLDAFQIMPNHVHFIIRMDRDGDGDGDGATTRVARTLGDVVGGFKSITSVEYIKINPIRWSRDKNNPHNCKIDL